MTMWAPARDAARRSPGYGGAITVAGAAGYSATRARPVACYACARATHASAFPYIETTVLLTTIHYQRYVTSVMLISATC